MALEHWRALSACYGLDINLFYLERGEKAALPEGHKRDMVEEVCLFDCPVRVVCLNENYHDGFGTWGGWRAENRNFVRRSSHPCPWCDTEIPVEPSPRLFCDDDCLESAVFSQGEDHDLLYKRLAEMEERAAAIIKERKPGPSTVIDDAVMSDPFSDDEAARERLDEILT